MSLPLVLNARLSVFATAASMLLVPVDARAATETSPVAGESVAVASHDHDQQLRSASLGTTRNVHRAGTIRMGGQPSEEDLQLAKKAGVGTVITLRTRGEISWDERAVVERAGMKFIDLGFRDPADLTDEVFDKSRQALARANPESGVLVHCASANRVGALWLAFRVLDGNRSVEQANQEAATVGLKTEAYRAKALDYIKRQQQK